MALKHVPKRLAFLFASCLITGTILVGCAAPKETVAVHDAAQQTLAAYVKDVDEKLDDVVDKWQKAEKGRHELLFQNRLEAAEREGKLTVEEYKQALAVRDEKFFEIDKAVAEYKVFLVRQKLKLYNYREFSREISDYLGSSGIDAETASGLGNVLLEALTGKLGQ